MELAQSTSKGRIPWSFLKPISQLEFTELLLSLSLCSSPSPSPSNMQRLSLGSPVSKLHSHGGAAVAAAREDAPTAEDTKRRDSFSASSLLPDYDGEDRKAAKLNRLSTSSLSISKPEKFVHLIPLLTLLCFLILYLCSHNPSQTDLAEFNRFKRSPKRIEDSTEIIDDIGRLSDLQKSNVLSIRSLRNLHEIRKRSPKSQLSRKLGDF